MAQSDRLYKSVKGTTTMIDNKYHFDGRDKNGKPIIIDIADLSGYGDYEVMAMRQNGEEIACAVYKSLDAAERAYHNMITLYALRDGENPPLKGKYAKLRDDLKAALEETAYLETTDDGGTCNFDSPVLELPRWDADKVIQAAEEAGSSTFKWTAGSTVLGWVFNPRSSGQGNRRTRRAEAISKALATKGYSASMYYQMD